MTHSPGKDPLLYVAAVSGTQVIAMSTPVLSPLIIGGLINGLGITEVDAGGLITIELLVIGVTVLIVSPFFNRLKPALVSIIGVALLLFAHYMSARVNNIESMYTWRMLGGLGTGLVLTCANVVAARAKNPSLLFGISWGCIYIMASLYTFIVAQSDTGLHYTTVFNSLALILLVFTPLLFFLPDSTAEKVGSGIPTGTTGSGLIFSIGVIAIVTGMMAYYAFLERLAVNLDASVDQIALTIILACVGGLVGGFSAVPIAARFGVVRPLLVTSSVHALVILVAATTTVFSVLACAASLEAIMFIIMIPLMYSLAAEIDGDGVWAGITGGVFTLSAAVGPLAGSLLIESHGYTSLGTANLLLLVPGFVAFYLTGRRVSHNLSGERVRG